MARPFKIPKRSAGSPQEGSERFWTQSPLSRLQDGEPHPEQRDRAGAPAGRKDMMHSGKGFGPGGGRSSFSQQHFRDQVKSYLGIQRSLKEPGGGSKPPHPQPPSPPPPAARPPFSLANGWRPKRASDRLSPDRAPLKKSSGAGGRGAGVRAVSVDPDPSDGEAPGPSAQRHPAPPLRPAPPPSPRAERRLTLNRTSWQAARGPARSPLPLGARRTPGSPAEPIVLSSEEEDGEQEEGVRPPPAQRTQAGGPVLSGRGPGAGLRGGASTADQTTPPSMELEFSDLHLGLTRAGASGTLRITEHAIILPLKGDSAGGGQCEVVVVASQVRGHGLWEGGVAGGGPAPSLLFLWVTVAQANLLQTEMSIIHPVSKHGGSCVFLLVVLSVSELQAALCLSLLGTEEYCCSSPLDLSQALRLLRDLPPPLHTHLLMLLGQPTEGSNQRTRSSAGQRLIQYPAPPSKGSITVTTEDLACLKPGTFLNDVIIDFYLKYLLLEGVPVGFSERCHVFSSFFFRQLSRRRAQGEEVPALLTREVRHQRVKTWTRHVDIFTKDFLFVPVNQEAHWYLLVICFPGLEGVQHQDWAGPVAEHQGKGSTDKSKAKPSASTLRPPECSQAGCERGRVLKRSCILVMDSLRLSAHENACRLLREYLQVEWQVRRGKARLFTPDTVCSAVCRLPLQDNSSDCGLYLLQYAESFLQNPVVHFDLPVRLEGWFPRQQIRSKRDQIRSLVLDLREDQSHPGPR
ncbi:sentrin-specific protease 7 [Gadus morhua]|uniref:sentrin-specific protease 7 n=1 Tax=Gadus morhua TaxID=8049 RepID=UPI0011B45368|nr:sentrin-specific protease 7-like [Gadus morhua]